jgi:glycosyltransferase involved in cell wall biosynthesis
MLRAVIASARGVAVHNRTLASDLRETYPDATIEAIRMGVSQPAASDAQIAAVRARHRIPDDAVVVSAFGAVSEEKRIVPLLRAVSVARQYQPGMRVLLVGQALPHFDAPSIAEGLRVDDIVTCTGFVSEPEVGAYLGAADIVSCLRWPSARETSASWLRAIAAERATIVTDLAQQADIPTLDPRSWSVLDAQPSQTKRPAIAVSIDVLDEDHSLTLALKRLTADRELRVRLGAGAAAYWLENHTVRHMVKDYEAVLARLRHSTPGHDKGPRHLRPDGLEHMRAILEPFGDHLPSPLI